MNLRIPNNDHLLADLINVAHKHEYVLAPDGSGNYQLIPSYIRRAEQARAERETGGMVEAA